MSVLSDVLVLACLYLWLRRLWLQFFWCCF